MPAREVIDFKAAACFLQQAEEAYDKGDDRRCLAARKLVLTALGFIDGPRGVLHAEHLQC